MTIVNVSPRLTVLEYNANCIVCGKRMEKGRLAGVVQGRKLVHVGRCSKIVEDLMRSEKVDA